MLSFVKSALHKFPRVRPCLSHCKTSLQPMLLRLIRRLATAAEGKSQFNVFDRNAKLLQKQRSSLINPDKLRTKDYLRDEVANRTIERLAFITRGLDRVLDFGSGSGNFLQQLCTTSEVPAGGDEADVKITAQLNADKETIRLKIKELVLVEGSKARLERDESRAVDYPFPGSVVRVCTDEEKFKDDILVENLFDAVISNLLLHWINDLPTTLEKINKVLKPDGLFMATLIGGDTLYELRTLLQLAELERRGGMAMRVSPLVHLNDISSLLNRAGFSMLTIDQEEIVIGGFPDIVLIMDDLQWMGEQNAVNTRELYLPKDVLLAANEIYKLLHGEVGPDGTKTLPVTVDIIFMIGWKKSDQQPKPLARGSGQIKLKDALKPE